MGEQEFLETFLQMWYGVTLTNLEKEHIRRWLETFHQTYHEVEFVRKDASDELETCPE